MSTGQEDETIGELLSRLADDARSFGEAEVAYYKALAAEKLAAARNGLLIAAIALALVLAAAIALVVGLVLTLTPLVGAALATLIVVIVTVGAGGLLGWCAWRNIKHGLGLRQ